MAVARSPMSERLARYLKRDPVTGCLEWTGSLGSGGYGQMSSETRNLPIGTHRVAWMAVNGDIPPGMFVCHTCDNRTCCNVEHLFLGTARDNNYDKMAKGRHRNADGSHTNSKLTAADVRDVVSAFGDNPSRGQASKLALQYGVSVSLISLILRGGYRTAELEVAA